MSGYWQCRGDHTHKHLSDVSQEKHVRERWPLMAITYEALAEWILATEHLMDWELSGEKCIDDDQQFCIDAFGDLLAGMMVLAPDAWFPRGKWATIQAVTDRMKKA